MERFDSGIDFNGLDMMYEAPKGQWVKWEDVESQLKETQEENRKLKEGVKVGKTIDYGEWLSYPCKNFDNCEINKSLHCYSLKPCFGTI